MKDTHRSFHIEMHVRQKRSSRAPESLQFLPLGIAILVLCASVTRAEATSLTVSVNASKASRGQTVEVSVSLKDQVESPDEPVRAVVLRPGFGIVPLLLQPVPDQLGQYRTEILVEEKAPPGLFVVHAWIGDKASPKAVGKSSFRVGNIVADFFVAPYVDSQKPDEDIGNYLSDFRDLGGNFLIAHNLIIAAKAFYPSRIARTDVQFGSQNDIVELLLTRADRDGLGVLLSVSWDMTRESHFKDRMKEIKAIIAELYSLYRHHPCLAGFYSYQEGSGTYYAGYVREFAEYIKSLDPGLQTACAPHIDDPLLAGYLSVIAELDILIYQTGVMASYRPDNRKKYPIRRVKDFSALGAGAKRVQGKTVLTHIELFAYREKRQQEDLVTASRDDISQQILSAATATDTDGIAFFAYHAHIFAASKTFAQARPSRSAVINGLKAYELVTSTASKQRQHLALYVPYSDWVIERWPNYFLPALDAFRTLGVPTDVLPYAPPDNESVYPYYPFHHREEVLNRLLEEKTILVLANVSGFQQTDSDLIKPFVERGGVIVAFGEQIPMGRSYERSELFGGDEAGDRLHSSVAVKNAVGHRVSAGTRVSFGPRVLPSWRSTGAKVIAAFEDGTAAIVMNRFGRGLVVTIIPDVRTAVVLMPQLVRDAIDLLLESAGAGPLVEVNGANENVDIAFGQVSEGRRIVIVNHNYAALRIRIKAPFQEQPPYMWFDVLSGERLGIGARRNSISLSIPPRGYRVVDLRNATKPTRRMK